jgi:hypothetical protein
MSSAYSWNKYSKEGHTFFLTLGLASSPILSQLTQEMMAVSPSLSLSLSFSSYFAGRGFAYNR